MSGFRLQALPYEGVVEEFTLKCSHKRRKATGQTSILFKLFAVKSTRHVITDIMNGNLCEYLCFMKHITLCVRKLMKITIF
jgi:hypothetical protein